MRYDVSCGRKKAHRCFLICAADASSHGSAQFNIVVGDSELFMKLELIQLRTIVEVHCSMKETPLKSRWKLPVRQFVTHDYTFTGSGCC